MRVHSSAIRIALIACLLASTPGLADQTSDLNYERFLSEGATLMHLKHFAEALAKFDQALVIKPKSAHALSLRARALKNLNRREQALADVKKAMACDPKSVQPYLCLAGFSMKDRDIAKARQYLAQAEKIEPHNYEVAGMIGTCLTIQKKYKEALHYVNESLTKHPDAHRFAQRAALYRLLGDHKSELKDYDKAVSLDPKSTVYATERATTYWQGNRLQDALTEINRALSLDPKYGQGYYIRANIYWSLKQAALVLSDMARAISLEDSGTFYHFRGSIYEAKGELKRALNDQLKADKLSADQPHIKFALSRLYHRLLEPKQALQYVTEAIKLEPKNPAQYEHRSEIYRTMMEYELSVADDTKAIEFAKEPPINSLVNRVRYYRAKKKFDLALRDQNRIISYYPGRVGLKEGRALIYLEKGDYKHAKEDYDAIMLRFPNEVNLSSRALVNLKLKKFNDALADCNRAIVKQPGMSSYYLLRADIHKAMGKTEDAQKDVAAARAADQASLPPR
ncbi:MAG: tetratricopeptide repeat protein [Candidatus Melainabacteria bacterium]|nr:tetratricopeptide repeat protein [Candidatus Melainabacteria bacterium]